MSHVNMNLLTPAMEQFLCHQENCFIAVILFSNKTTCVLYSHLNICFGEKTSYNGILWKTKTEI